MTSWTDEIMSFFVFGTVSSKYFFKGALRECFHQSPQSVHTVATNRAPLLLVFIRSLDLTVEFKALHQSPSHLSDLCGIFE